MIRKYHNHKPQTTPWHHESVKYFLLRAFSEKLKQLSSVLANIWRLEATYIIQFEM